jgi:FkbM family methyltransferase
MKLHSFNFIKKKNIKQLIKYFYPYYSIIYFYAFIKHIRLYHNQVKYGVVENKYPFIKYKNKIFYGFYPPEKEIMTFNLLKWFLPRDFQKTHYRLMRDFITRYIYPHMMPTLKPHYPTFLLSGFHRQHKDAIDDIRDENLRNELKDIFSIKHDDVIINGGAYIGIGDIRVSEMNPNGKIIAVEAEKANFEMLKLNLKSNNVNNVLPLNNALWNKKRKMEMDTTNLQANSLVEGIVESTDKQTVECITIDEIVRSKCLKKVDFVSLTLNGAEVEALDGMKETLSLYRPRLRLAGWYYRGNDPIWKISSEKLKRFNYKVVVGKRGSVFAYNNDKKY